MYELQTDEPTDSLDIPQQDRPSGQTLCRPLAGETIPDDFSRKLSRLLAETAGHDPNAFAEIYRLTSGVLFKIAMLITKRCDHAEAILQSSYVRIWREASTFDASLLSPMNWMTTIVRTSAIAFMRQDTDQAHERAPCPQRPLDARSPLDFSRAHLKNAMAGSWINDLEPDMQSMLMAAYLHGETREQLSNRFGISVGAVRSLLRQALLKAGALSYEPNKPEERNDNG